MSRYRVEIDGESFEVEIEVVGGIARATVSSPREKNTILVTQRRCGALESRPAAGGGARRSIPLTSAESAEIRFLTGAHDVVATVASQRDLLRLRLRPPAAPSRRLVIVSEIPGVVRAVRVQPGEEIEHGAALLTLEAMKMENDIRTTAAGIVRVVHVRAGSVVAAGEPLAEIELHH